MRLGPFTIARTKALERKSSHGPLSGVDGSRSWLSFIRETSAGGWQRNEEVSLDTALQNPTLFACVTLIASDISKLRPMLVQQDEDRVWTEVDNAAFSPILQRPNSYQEWADYAEWYITSKLLCGNVYVLKERDARGVVRALYVLDPNRVEPLVAADGSVFYRLTMDPLAQVEQAVVVPAREIIHDRVCPLFHPLVGISPIYAAGFAAGQGLTIRRASEKFVANGSRPGGILLVPGNLSQPQADAMKTEWKAAFSGDKQGDIALLTGGMSYIPMGMMTSEQSQVIEQLRMTDEDIAKCFHMPRHKVGIGPDPTYTNIQAKNQDYYNDCLQKHVNNFNVKHTKGIEVDNVTGKTLAIELDLNDLLLMDMAAKADAASKAITAGLSYNETRFQFWDRGPVKGGESPMSQQQNFHLEALARRDEAGPAPAVPGAGSAAPANDPSASPDPSAPESKRLDLAALLPMVSRKVAELSAA